MNARLRVLSGARSGAELQFDRRCILGRSAEADLRLDPLRDLHVSGRHAEVYAAGDSWWVRDLGSRNGTFLNGRRIDGHVHLMDGDQLQLGEGGATIEFRAPFLALALSSPQPVPLAAPTLASPEPRRTHALTAIAIAFGVLAIASLAVASWSVQRQRGTEARLRAEMQVQVDSLLAAGDGRLQRQLDELTAALRDSEAEVSAARERLAEAERGRDATETTRRQAELELATLSLERRQGAAALDFSAIENVNRRAIAVVYVEVDGGGVSVASAFAVRPDATLITSRHAVYGENGLERPTRIGVQFADSRQVWPARVIASSGDADLALLKIDNIIGDVPVVRSLSLRGDSLAPGSPVAILGYPLGGDVAESDGLARPVTTAGVIQATGGEHLEVEGYGAAGASGSPIFDASGEVVGIVFGGQRRDGGHTIFAVPVARALSLLRSVGG